MMEVDSSDSYKCNICQMSYTDLNILVKHCQHTHVKTETESRGHDTGSSFVCPEPYLNSEIIKYEVVPKDTDLPPEKGMLQSKNSDKLLNETNKDSLVCENSVCKDSNVEDSKTKILKPGLDVINSQWHVANIKMHGPNPEENETYPARHRTILEGQATSLMGHKEEMKSAVPTKLKNSNKRLYIELTRIDYLLEEGICSLMLAMDEVSQGPEEPLSVSDRATQGPEKQLSVSDNEEQVLATDRATQGPEEQLWVSERASQGIEEQFEIKIERAEDCNFDIPISDTSSKTEVISNIKTEDLCKANEKLKLEDIKTEQEDIAEEILSKCYICYKEFAKRSGMFRHLREVHKGMSKEEWKVYSEIKAKEKLLCRTCHICNKVSATYQENKRHKLKHVHVKDFQCHLCGELFRQRQTMLNHVFRHTGVKKHKCEHCSITMFTKSQLNVHMRTHTKEKLFKCEECSSRFASKEILKIHMRTHTGEKPYKCDVCSKAFISVTALRVHCNLHTGVKKFQCQICNKSFSQNAHLKTHARVHTGERPYSCSECDKTFVRKHHLNNHKKIHTGEKPYRCSVCFQRFALKQYLVIHLRVHTGEKPYKCPVCHVGFSQYTEQKVHTKRHLKSDYVTPGRKLRKRKSASVKKNVLKLTDE